ncbi:MAG TPA: hypothetical protein VHU83_06300 [Bryobacteraceae bacterium]|jgi:hypothetical protein|nr:hypothetical protein [Bryobacteraceae bacterium]
MVMASIHEQHGRLVKAVKLADVLDALHITAAAAADLTKANWKLFALIANVPTPSIEAQQAVVELLKARESMREWVARSVVNGLVAQRSAA